jgi:hypothetical protein
LLNLILSLSALSFLCQEVKDLTAKDLLVLSDLSKSSSEEDSTSEPELVADQPTVAAAAHNLVNRDAWTPIATGPPLPVPPEFRVPPEFCNLKPPPKKKNPPRRRSARIHFTQPKKNIKNQKTKENQEKKVPSIF